MKYRWFACLLAVTLLIPYLGFTQSMPSDAVGAPAASYIMAWRWESADGKSTLDVSSSSLLLFEGKLYDYDLSGGALRFLAGGTTVPYRYDPATDRLTLQFADTAQVEYHRTIQSVLARRGTRRLPEDATFLFGRYSTVARRSSDTAAPEQKTINFHANTEFDFGPRDYSTAGGAAGGTGSAAVLGRALVYGDAIIFSFYDSSAAEGQVETRNSRGDVRTFLYADEEYSLEPYQAAIYPTPTPYPVPEPVPGPPPPYPIPPWYPPYYPPYYPPHPYPVYYPPHYPGHHPPVIIGGASTPAPHSGSTGQTRTSGVHRDSGGGRSGSSVGSSRSGGSSGSSGGSSSGRGGSSSSGGSSRGGNRR